MHSHPAGSVLTELPTVRRWLDRNGRTRRHCLDELEDISHHKGSSGYRSDQDRDQEQARRQDDYSNHSRLLSGSGVAAGVSRD